MEIKISPAELEKLNVDHKGIKIYPDHLTLYFAMPVNADQALMVYDDLRRRNENLDITSVRFKFRCSRDHTKKCHSGADCAQKCDSTQFWNTPIRGIRIDFKGKK